jgi:predicted nuclease of predicted toxin-antitoxin system
MEAVKPGLILLRGGNYSEPESRDCIRRVLTAIADEDLQRSIVVVDRTSIRRRWLPL